MKSSLSILSSRCALVSMLLAACVLACSTPTPLAHSQAMRRLSSKAQIGKTRNIVIVHGAFADGSGWEAVYQILTRKGYRVRIVQNSTQSLASDVQATAQVLDQQDGPSVLVGHSYGGEVITEAGNHAKVKSLVYIAAFAPDAGESLASLSATPQFSPGPPVLPPVQGFLILDPAKFSSSFAADLAPEKADFLHTRKFL